MYTLILFFTLLRPMDTVWSFESAKYISRGRYDVQLCYNGTGLLVYGYRSHTWKRKTKFFKQYTFRNNKLKRYE